MTNEKIFACKTTALLTMNSCDEGIFKCMGTDEVNNPGETN